MEALVKPSRELAVKLLGQVDFQDRITLVWNNTESDLESIMYSLQEVVYFLGMDAKQLAGRYDSPYTFELSTLRDWIGVTLGDTELAAAIDALLGAEGENAPKDLLKSVKGLLEERLRQSKEVMRAPAAA